MHKILIYDPAQNSSAKMATAMQEQAEISCKTAVTELQAEMHSTQFDLIFLDIDKDEKQSLHLLDQIHSRDPFLPIIMTSASEKAQTIVEAMNRGASDFLVHPISATRIGIAVSKAIEIRDQRYEIAYHRRKQDVVYDFRDVVALSPKMKQILKSLERFARTDSTILITGETGTGKSFLSGTVHFNSPRRKKPFVKINCANIPEDLLESELFGHEKGSFTGADKQRIGRFEQASGGTIFLDEIGEMNMRLQTKLLRVLEEKSFERVGGNKTIYSDVRIIAATNRDLVSQVEKGGFREDLYYRINVLPVTLPSLRERKECLLPLAELLLKKCCASMHRDIRGFSDGAKARILDYNWPGNIRQLSNTVERAVILEDDNVIHSSNLSLPEKIVRITPEAQRMGEASGSLGHGGYQADHMGHGGMGSVTSAGGPGFGGGNMSPQGRLYGNSPVLSGGPAPLRSLADQEKELILQVLEESLWVQKVAARKLGISPRALNYKISKLGITHPHWRRNKGQESLD